MPKIETNSAVSQSQGAPGLVRHDDGKLSVSTTSNQDSPIMDLAEERGDPLLACDLWEHAYYLKYNYKREEYLPSFWNIVNWKQVSSLFSREGPLWKTWH